MIRDILDYQGNVIGQLELPDDTPEEVWTQRLALYAVAPPSPTEQFQVELSRSVAESRVLADEIMNAFKARNLGIFLQGGVSNELAIAKSLWTHHRLRAAEITYGGVNYTIDVLNLCITGDLQTVYATLSLITPDDMSQPYHFLNSDALDYLKDLIGERI
jgi:hypothetical protein